MKPRVVAVVVLALGFGGHRLYRQRRAASLEAAVVGLICDSEFLTQAEPAIRALSSLGATPAGATAPQQWMLQSATEKNLKLAAGLADWARTHLPPDPLRALSRASLPRADDTVAAIAASCEQAKVVCPARLTGLKLATVELVVATMIERLKQTEVGGSRSPDEAWTSWLFGS